MLDAFKKSTHEATKPYSQTTQEIYFRITPTKETVYLSVSTHADLPLEQINPSLLSETEQQLLKRILLIKQKESFTISWGEEGDTDGEFFSPKESVSLTEHPELFMYLKQCNNIITPESEALVFSPNLEKVMITISENEKKQETLSAKLTLSENKPLRVFLSEQYVMSDKTIYEILPVGLSYAMLQDSAISFPASFLLKYLSIIFSHFGNVQIIYRDYQITLGEAIQTHPVLMIDDIGENNNLHIRLAHQTGGFEPDFFQTYDITKLATIDDAEKSILIHTLDNTITANAHFAFQNVLKKYQKELKEKNSYIIDETGITLTEKLAKILMENELSTIFTKYHVMGAKQLKRYRIHATKPKLNLSLTEGINFFEGDASLQIGEEKFGIFEALQLYKKNAYIPLANGDKAILDSDYLKKLSRLFQKQKEGKTKISFFDLPLVDELINDASKKHWPKTRALFEGFNTIEALPLKHKKLGVTLRDYQIYGVKWLRYLYDSSLAGCLADDMGLGKTIQAIALLSHIYPKTKQPSLVVVPKSLLFNWQRELQKVNSALSVYLYYQDQRDMAQITKNNVIITTYHTLRSDIAKFKDISFDTVILDESGNIKNPDSQISKAVVLLQAKHRFALSGTPIENSLNELFALFRFLEPSMFRDQADFLQQYLYPIQKENDAEALNALRKKIYPFILRRTKKQVLPDLPDKIEQVVLVDLSPEYAAVYEKRRKYYYDLIQNQVEEQGIQKSQFFIFQALSELRQLVSCPEEKSEGLIVGPKREMLKEQLSEALANNHKVLVFTQFINALETIASDVAELGVDYVTLSGATKNREKVVDQFENDPHCRVFISTLKTGGFGLNLTVADTVFIYDPWWNQSAENQAIDRTHRMGQKNTVFAYKLIAKGTIEEKMLQLQEKKAKLFSQLLSTDASFVKSLSEDDMKFLLT
jgi:SNF2 family DNA or RNA helicase